MKSRPPFLLPVSLLTIIILSFLITATANAQTYSILYDFRSWADGAIPTGNLISDGAGNLYGTTLNGGLNGRQCTNAGHRAGCGTVYKLNLKTGKKLPLYAFTGGADGANPNPGLIRDPDGTLYGTTVGGGDLTCAPPTGCGTVFKLDSAGQETVLHRFGESPDGFWPRVGLLRDAAGNLYGSTEYGGAYEFGTVFKLDPSGTETILHNFAGGTVDGCDPDALVRDAAGNFYSTTFGCGMNGFGTVLKIDAAGNATTLYNFAQGPGGHSPRGGVVIDEIGNLYGTAALGGDFSCDGTFACGTVFKLDTAGNETVLHTFAGPDGKWPEAGLIRDQAGNLYGTTGQGGRYGLGTVFQLDASGNYTLLYSFVDSADGAWPTIGRLARDPQGNLYGGTQYGGTGNCNIAGPGCGVIFKISFP